MSARSPLALVIPAYQPTEALEALVPAVLAGDRDRLFRAVVVVDDGSDASCAARFARVAAVPGVELIRHAANRGKGAALKTGFARALGVDPPISGVVTADADGQHAAGDILRVARALADGPDRLVLGVRRFGADVPLRSRVGNMLTRRLVRAMTGVAIEDTQTGLRGVPRALAQANLSSRSDGYEHELDTLLTAIRGPILQVPIETIYEAGNRSSHFRPLADSVRVYGVLAHHALKRAGIRD